MSDASSSSMQAVVPALPLIRCPVCGRALVRTFVVRRVGENQGRRFYKCPNAGAGGCNFWEWHEQYAMLLNRMQFQRGVGLLTTMAVLCGLNLIATLLILINMN